MFAMRDLYEAVAVVVVWGVVSLELLLSTGVTDIEKVGVGVKSGVGGSVGPTCWTLVRCRCLDWDSEQLARRHGWIVSMGIARDWRSAGGS